MIWNPFVSPFGYMPPLKPSHYLIAQTFCPAWPLLGTVCNCKERKNI